MIFLQGGPKFEVTPLRHLSVCLSVHIALRSGWKSCTSCPLKEGTYFLFTSSDTFSVCCIV